MKFFYEQGIIKEIKGGAWMSGVMEFVKGMKDDNPDVTKEQAYELLLAEYPPNNPDNPEGDPIGMSQSSKSSNVEAKSSGEKNENSNCSQHLFSTKLQKINELLKEGNEYEVFSILRELKTEYPNDDKIVRLIAKTMFDLLLKSQDFRNIEILQHIFTKAEVNFFDTILCSFVFGILVLLETDTEKEIIEQIGERMSKMSPGLIKTVLKQLPKEVYHPDIKKKFEKIV